MYTFQLLLHEYREEIKALKLELAMHDTLSHRGSVCYDKLGEEERKLIEKQVEMFIDGAIPEIKVRNIN